VNPTIEAGEDRPYSLTRLPGWLQMVHGPPRSQPPQLPAAALAALPARDLARYNDARAVWHANLGPIRTPQLLDLHERLAEIVEANRQDGDKNRPAALVDSYPGLGKTTAVLDYARCYHREQVDLRGESTTGGHRRVPVAYVALTATPTSKGSTRPSAASTGYRPPAPPTPSPPGPWTRRSAWTPAPSSSTTSTSWTSADATPRPWPTT